MTEASRWTLHERQVLHEGPFIRLLRDTVAGPGSAAFAYEHVQVADAVRVVALDATGQLLIVEDEFYLTDSRLPHLPGGGVEPGETPEAAARRELEEETGTRATHWQLLGRIHPLPGSSSATTHLFLATGLAPGTVARDATEGAMTVHRCSLADAVAQVLAGTITEAGSVTALLLVDRMPADRAHPGPETDPRSDRESPA
ncbi:NUDIX domain-containing protein [Kitasatospora sp. LaBMicrA B282]|uniref:NUDIX domain-containing protein n=1 Tax=Kitasatospora sp. LaBMicrA B282 TaxID=3420949 RepID=UPI003D140803